MSADNITANETAGRRESGKGVGDATGKKNAQTSSWRLFTGAPSWFVAEYQAHYGRLFDSRQLVEWFWMEETPCCLSAKVKVKIKILSIKLSLINVTPMMRGVIWTGGFVWHAHCPSWRGDRVFALIANVCTASGVTNRSWARVWSGHLLFEHVIWSFLSDKGPV